MKTSRASRRRIARSGRAECPICSWTGRLAEHHINGRNVEDPNGLWNLAYICNNCHEEIHSGDIVIEGNYMTTQGYELFWHKSGKEDEVAEGAVPYLYGDKNLGRSK